MVKKYVCLLLYICFYLVGCCGDTNPKTISWDGNFYGVKIPQPKGYERALNIEEKVISKSNNSKATSVYIEGMKFEDYLSYYKTLQSLNGWQEVIRYEEDKLVNGCGCFGGKYKGLYVMGYYNKDEIKVQENKKKNPKDGYNFILVVSNDK